MHCCLICILHLLYMQNKYVCVLAQLPTGAKIYILNGLLHNVMVYLIRISLVSFLWDIGKQCKPRSDATECDV